MYSLYGVVNVRDKEQIMPGVFARGSDEPIDKLLRILKKQVEKAGIMRDLKKKEYHVKPSIAKTLKSRAAQKRVLKERNKNRK